VPARNNRTKRNALIEDGTLNPAPDKVQDPKFRVGEFFDPDDVVQVRYEMLRRASLDNLPVTEVAEEYGVSRPTYYQAKESFEVAGIAGLVPKKPGPRGPHKIDDQLLAFLQAHTIPGKPIRAREMAKLVQRELNITLHPRTIERALKKTAK
jgi:transposase